MLCVSPRGELGSERRSYPDEIRAFAESRETDLISRSSKASAAILPLALFDRFPSLLERREVPPAASRAHNPQPPLRAVEGELPPDGKMLYRLILPEL
jgi:hypothetical protein